MRWLRQVGPVEEAIKDRLQNFVSKAEQELKDKYKGLDDELEAKISCLRMDCKDAKVRTLSSIVDQVLTSLVTPK